MVAPNASIVTLHLRVIDPIMFDVMQELNS